jgi:hypothetical protein
MRRLLLLTATLALMAGAFQSADGAAPREKRVPKLIGLERSDAEARLARHGFRYLLPARHAVRYEAVSPGAEGSEQAIPEKLAPDRRVVVQSPSPGGLADRGDVIEFGTVLPPHAGKREADVFFHPVARPKVGDDRRELTLPFRAFARRCQALDHVDVGFGSRYVVAAPSLTDTIKSDERCRHLSKRAVHLELSRSVGDRIVVDGIPTGPRRGLHRIAPTPYGSARGERHARAVAVDFGHSSDCGLLARAKARETRHTVRITLFTGNIGRSTTCLANLITDLTVVPLRHPLGHRRIVDGARHR